MVLKDGIVNAGIEHMEAIMMANYRFKPVPWLSVIFASFPGLLVALSRRHAALLDPLLRNWSINKARSLTFTANVMHTSQSNLQVSR
jgi:hypothetical protein